MTPGWETGRGVVDEMLARGDLQRVPANRDLARSHLDQARDHLASAEGILDRDAIGSFQLAYDAARKALASLLAVQGLRPTSSGGHVAVADAIDAQFGAVLGTEVRRFSWMRRIRIDSEYPSLDRSPARHEDAQQALLYSAQIIDAAKRLIDELPIY